MFQLAELFGVENARDAGVETPVGCHMFRATGITAYLKKGGSLVPELRSVLSPTLGARYYGRRGIGDRGFATLSRT
jgi:hypothetical protein